MVKSVVVTLTVTVPDTELGNTVNVVSGANTYAGKITAILTHPDVSQTTVPPTASVTISGPGLKTA